MRKLSINLEESVWKASLTIRPYPDAALKGLAPDASSRDWIVGRSAYGSKSGGVEGRWVRGKNRPDDADAFTARNRIRGGGMSFTFNHRNSLG